MPTRIGSVPYLNAKPLVDWFHTPECDVDAEVTYHVPSHLAVMLREDALDVANVSIFEAFQNPELALVPGVSISARQAVKSVRLFSRVPFKEIKSVALDTSSLTSVALTKILLAEEFGVEPVYHHAAPDLQQMLSECDAGLIIGDLKLFHLHPGFLVYDLGQGWYDLTGLPFVYAAWLARRDRAYPELPAALQHARDWGAARLPELALKWSGRMDLPLSLCEDYFLNVMDYGLDPDQMRGLLRFQQTCYDHDLIPTMLPITELAP